MDLNEGLSNPIDECGPASDPDLAKCYGKPCAQFGGKIKYELGDSTCEPNAVNDWCCKEELQ